MSDKARGLEREKSVAREVYFSDAYFSMPQLCSFAHQLHHIWKMRPKSVIEVGLGNGFVSTFLKRSGIPVTTVDINPALEPDICAPLSELSKHVKVPVDLVVCCEVLEHMPIEELDANLDYLRTVGSRLFLTLPNVNRTFGFAGFANIPKLGACLFDLNFDFPYKNKFEGGAHFWEVGFDRSTSRSSIIDRLRSRYTSVKSGRFTLKPYHIWFECE